MSGVKSGSIKIWLNFWFDNFLSASPTRVVNIIPYPRSESIYDPDFHSQLIDMFIAKTKVNLEEANKPIDLKPLGSNTINYDQLKKKNSTNQEVPDSPKPMAGRKYVSVQRLLQTEHFFRSKFLPKFEFEDSVMLEEVCEISEQLLEHFKSNKK